MTHLKFFNVIAEGKGSRVKLSDTTNTQKVGDNAEKKEKEKEKKH